MMLVLLILLIAVKPSTPSLVTATKRQETESFRLRHLSSFIVVLAFPTAASAWCWLLHLGFSSSFIRDPHRRCMVQQSRLRSAGVQVVGEHISQQAGQCGLARRVLQKHLPLTAANFCSQRGCLVCGRINYLHFVLHNTCKKMGNSGPVNTNSKKTTTIFYSLVCSRRVNYLCRMMFSEGQLPEKESNQK